VLARAQNTSNHYYLALSNTDYTLDDPNNVRTIVMAGVGVGKI
jgi:hypothetical protein